MIVLFILLLSVDFIQAKGLTGSFFNFMGKEMKSAGYQKYSDYWMDRHPKIKNILNYKTTNEQIKILHKKWETVEPILKIYYHDNLLTKKEYEEIINNYAKDIKDIDAVINHIEKNKKKLNEEGKELYPGMKQFLHDIKHIRDYTKKNKIEIGSTIALNITTMAVLAELLKILIVAGL